MISDDGETHSDNCEIPKIDNSVNIDENESSFATYGLAEFEYHDGNGLRSTWCPGWIV